MLKYAMKNQQVMKDSNIEYKNKYIYYVFVISILVCHLAISEEADSDKPIEIEADTMTVEETKNTSTYEGDVILTQGSLLINADKLIIREDRQGFQHSTSIGNPTTFRQKMEGSDEYIEGKALRIEYDGHMDKIHLYEKAFVKRGDDEVWGDYIMYDATSEFAQALSRKDENGSKTKKGRTKAIIKPKKIMPTLTIQNLRKSYKKNIVVKNVSLKIASGQIVGLLGPNGAGKTTTFYMIVGLIAADHGNILLDQKNLTKTPIHIRAKQGISYLPQEPSIFRKMDVSENIISILELRNLSKHQIKLELESLLKELNIQHIKNNTAISLSGGERRRVEIARCLANKPKFILLDEPFAGIDPIAVIDIQKIIKQLASNGIGILITDHSVRETLGICDQAYIVNQGEIFAQGTPKVIAQNQSVKDIYLGENFIL